MRSPNLTSKLLIFCLLWWHGTAEARFCSSDAKRIDSTGVGHRIVPGREYIFEHHATYSETVLAKISNAEISIRWRLLDLPENRPVRSRGPSTIGPSFHYVAPGKRLRLCIWSEDTENTEGLVRLDMVSSVQTSTNATLLSIKADEHTDALAKSDLYEQAAREYVREERPELAAAMLYAAGANLLAEGNATSAELLLWASLQYASKSNDESYKGWIAHLLSKALTSSGKFSEAILLLQKLVDSNQDPRLLSEACNQLGIVLYETGDFEGASEHFRCAKKNISLRPHPILSLKVSANLASVERRLGNTLEAASVFDLLAEQALSLSNKQIAIVALTNAANTYSSIGEFAEAHDRLVRAIALEPSDQNERTDVLIALGQTYMEVANWEKAIEHFRAALHSTTNTGHFLLEGVIKANIGRALTQSGKPSEGLDWLEMAVEQLESAGAHPNAGMAQCELARTALRAGMSENALAGFAELTRQLVRSATDDEDQLNLCASLVAGEIASYENDFANAIASFEMAVKLASSLDSDVNQISALTGLAQAHFALSEHEGVVRAALKANQLLSEKWPGLPAGAHRRSILEHFRSLTDLHVVAVARSAPLSDGKASLVASLSARRLVTEIGAEKASDRNPERFLDLENLSRALARKARIDQRKPTDEFAELLFDTVDPVMPASSGNTLLNQSSPSAGLPLILNENDFNILYFHLSDDDGLMWFGRDSSTLQRFSIPGNDYLRPLINTARTKLKAGKVHNTELAELASLLIEPIMDQLNGQPIVIIPDRALYGLPFASLPIASEGFLPLGMKVPLVHARSLVTSEYLLNTPRSAAMLIALDPSSQAPSVAGSLIERKSLQQSLGDGAVRVKQTSNLGPRSIGAFLEQPTDILHISAHAYANSAEPGLSAIMSLPIADTLDPGRELLTAQEIASLDIKADLVVLAACETGAGRVTAGSGPLSLAGAFLDAGAKTVVSTLWRVSDGAAVAFTNHFYSYLTNGKLSVPDAFRKAQQQLRGTRRWRAPRHWAAFVLVNS